MASEDGARAMIEDWTKRYSGIGTMTTSAGHIYRVQYSFERSPDRFKPAVVTTRGVVRLLDAADRFDAYGIDFQIKGDDGSEFEGSSLPAGKVGIPVIRTFIDRVASI